MPWRRPGFHALCSPRERPAYPVAPTRATARAATAAVQLALAAAVVTAIGWAPSTQAQGQGGSRQTKTVDIPAGPLTEALNRFAEDSGVFLSAPAELTQGKTSPGLSGAYTVDQGFAELLRGQGLEIVRQANGGYALRPTPPTPGAAAGTATLPTVWVTAGAATAPGESPPLFAGGQVARGAQLGVLGNLDYMEAPFSVTAYTDDLIRARQVTEIRDIVAQKPSLIVTTSRGNYNNGFQLRGFDASLRLNGLKGVANADVQTDAYERIEILDGPNALLFGDFGGIGGTINLVPKRAGDEPLTRAALRYESRSQIGPAFDVGRRFGPNREFGIRLNASGTKGESEVNSVKDTHLLGALALDLRLDRVRASFDVITQRNASNVIGWGSYPITVASGRIPDPVDITDLRRGPRAASQFSKHVAEDRNMVGQLEFDLTDRTRLKLAYGTFRWTYNYASADYDAATSTEAIDAYNASRGIYGTENEAFRASLSHQIDTGPIRHQLVIAFDQNKSASLAANPDFNDIFLSYTRPAGDYSNQPRFALLDGDLSGLSTYGATVEQSVGVVNRFGPKDGSWMVIAGLRRQNVRNDAYDAGKTTATLGAMARLTPTISIYGNHGQGLEAGQAVPPFYNQEQGLRYENAGEVLSPHTSKSYELGVKLDRGAIGATAALFQISRPSVVSTALSTTVYRLGADGEQVNRGIEFNLFGEPIKGLRLTAGVAFLDPKLTGTEGGVNDGKVAVGTPKRGASVYGEWDLPRVEGLTLAGGLNYRSRQFADAANATWTGGYTTVDAGLRYQPPRLPRARLSLNVTNLFAKDYWEAARYGSSWYGVARTVKLSASFDF